MRQVFFNSIRHQGFASAAEFLDVGTEHGFRFAFRCQQRDAAAGLGGEQADDAATGSRRDDEVEVFGFNGGTRVEDRGEEGFRRAGGE